MSFEAQLYHGKAKMADHTPVAEIAAGEVVPIGGKAFICHRTIPAGELGALAEGGGTYLVPKTTGEAWAAGDPLFWDDTTNKATTDSDTGANARLGFAEMAASSGATTGYASHQLGD